MKKITKKSKIGDILKSYPKSADIMARFGLYCVACLANEFDSLEDAAVIHELPEGKVNEMVDEINKL